MTCDVERGKPATGFLCPDAFRMGLFMARATSCHTPDIYLLIRKPRPKYLYLSGSTSSLLLGVNGHIPHDRSGITLAALHLHDGPCHLISTDATAPTPTRHVLPGGSPCLTWTTSWQPWESHQELGQWLHQLHEALLTTGLIEHPSPAGDLSIEWKDADDAHPQGSIGGPHPHDDWHIAASWLAWLQAEGAHARRHGDLTAIWRTDGAQSPQLCGWRSPPPYEVVGWYQPPKALLQSPHPVELPAPSAPHTPHSARQQKSSDGPPTPGVALHWRWRDKAALQGLSPDVIDGLLTTGRVPLFEKMVRLNPKHSPKLWGELLIRWPRHLRRKGCPVDSLSDERWMALAAHHGMGLCHRESLRDLLAFASYFPDEPIKTLLRNHMGVTPTTDKALRKQLPDLLAGPLPRATAWASRERFWMGRLMQQLRGALPGKTVRRELYRYFSEHPPTPLDECAFPPPTPRKTGRR